jgi:hypothetical protein
MGLVWLRSFSFLKEYLDIVIFLVNQQYRSTMFDKLSYQYTNLEFTNQSNIARFEESVPNR